MKKVLLGSLVLALGVALVSSAAFAKKQASGYGSYDRTANWSEVLGMDNQNSPNSPMYNGGLHASAAANTVVMGSYKFDSGATCTAQGWVTQDITLATGQYWHVDDFALSDPVRGDVVAGLTEAGITFTPLQGTKSMWMGQRKPPASPVDPIHCGYLGLPGYGTAWNQSFCTKTCLSTAGGPTAGLDIAFKIKFDSEYSYDWTTLDYTTDCTGQVGWTEIAGGKFVWDDGDSVSFAQSFPGVTGNVKVRFHFTSDAGFSSQDSQTQFFGVAVDSLKAETLTTEDFEGEALDAHSSNDWEICNSPGFGNYLALFKKATGANYEDQCLDNLSCYWAAIQGSTEFYNCGSPAQPSQRIVPHFNVRNEYISNEIWSPQLALAGSSGTDFRLRYTVYRDLPLDNLIFHVWHVRTTDTSGCPSAWADRNFVYYGDNKDWLINENLIGSKINATTGVTIQLAIGVIDQGLVWTGQYGTGACHSPAPYIDQVKILRIQTFGPQWDVRDLETFNDNFSANGSITGTARFDEANDVRPAGSLAVVPGDSAVVLFLVDPASIGASAASFPTVASGLSADPVLSTFAAGRHKTKRQAYMWVKVWPTQAAKTGAPLSDGPGGQSNRYPWMSDQVIGGVTWSKIRMDYTYQGNPTNVGDGHAGTATQAAKFNVDLNDDLFTPGDTILYFYGATSPGGTTYYSSAWGVTTVIDEVAANPMEVTILPAGGFNRGGDVLYVDGYDGGGVQNYYDGAFQVLSLDDKVDRFDVRGPTSGVSNRLGSRVTNVVAQLNGAYQKIIWDSGISSITLGDGSGNPEKTDDYGVMVTFLNNLSNPGGVMLLGDRVSEYLDSYGGANAVTFKSSYMPFTLINNNHRLAPSLFVISPSVKFWPGRAYSDNFNLFGGCPALNDFDVLGASGTSRVEMSYNTASTANGAVLSNKAQLPANPFATVILTGFSLAYVRDDELNGISDRADFLRNSIVYMGNPLDPTTGGGEPVLKDDLSQNYPNPFNPQTSIAFSIKDRGAVSLKVYNVNGELVKTIVNENRAAGSYTEKWDGHNEAGQTVSSGVYFYKLVTNNFSQTKKMVLLK